MSAQAEKPPAPTQRPPVPYSLVQPTSHSLASTPPPAPDEVCEASHRNVAPQRDRSPYRRAGPDGTKFATAGLSLGVGFDDSDSQHR